MNELLHGAAAGALRGGAAAIAYAVVLTLWTIVSDLITTHVTHTTSSRGFGASSVLVVGVFALFAAFLALIVGAIGGALLGAALVPVARRWRGSTTALCAGCASLVFGVAALAFPAVPLGSGVDGLDELVSLKLIPAALAAAAAGWHVGALRSGVSSGRASSRG